MSGFRSVVLWLFILFLGVALGAGVYESRIVLPLWLTPTGAGGYFWDADAARQANTGVNFWVYVTTVPLTLLTIASLVLAWRSHPPLRHWWLTAGLISMVERLFTFGYFIPTMITLMSVDALIPGRGRPAGDAMAEPRHRPARAVPTGVPGGAEGTVGSLTSHQQLGAMPGCPPALQPPLGDQQVDHPAQPDARTGSSVIIVVWSPPKVVSIWGHKTRRSRTSHSRLTTIDVVSAELRIIHSRCSANRR
ncbi:MAG: hypothetical protein ACT4NP_00755 [Pseudonocardiales bacterium]